MNFSFCKMVCLIRHLAFVTVVYAIVVQPAVQAFASMDTVGYELVDFNGEEEEKQEEDVKDEKIDLQITNTSYSQSIYNIKLSFMGNQGLIRDFTLEIPIPPPERA